MGEVLPKVVIYTDGACSGNPGPGGWAAVLVAGGHQKEIAGYEPSTTNNRMEQTAALMALRELNLPCDVELYSDSAYLISAFNMGWLDTWQRNGWKNAAGRSVSNPDLWRDLLKEAARHQVKWIKVKGHADVALNNRCDELAVEQIARNRN